MRGLPCRLGSLLLLLLILCSTSYLSAATYNLNYTLSGAGLVSLNIYNSQGKIVRELVRTAQRSSGANTEIWDGLDNNGTAVPTGSYTWKLLRTPSGLTAEFLLNVGNNYVMPAPPVGFPAGTAPGNHNGVVGVAVDASGMYALSGGAENVLGSLKQNIAGTTRLWSSMQTGSSIATDGTNLFSINGTTLYKQNAANSVVTAQYTLALNGSGPTHVDVNGSNLVLIYADQNTLRWIDPANGAVLDSATITAPQGVTVSGDGTVYVTTADKIVKLTRADHTLVNVVTGLTSPSHLDMDHSTNQLLVFCAGSAQQVKRYTSTGQSLSTYGQAGGRVDGLYTTTMQESFTAITDLCADGSGGFFIAEPWCAPRRVSHFNSGGSVINEWYGGQQWAPWVCHEPDDPTAVWMMTDWGDIMRMTVNYTTKTWQVHSTYQLNGLANGLVQQNLNGQVWKVFVHNGTIYLSFVQATDYYPCVLKVDETNNWRLVPVVFGDLALWHDSFATPQYMKDWAAAAGCANGSYLWTDANGDGLPQQSEVAFSTVVPSAGNPTMDANLNAYYVDSTSRSIRCMAVTGWNAAGAPLYANFPAGVNAGSLPSRNVGWYFSPFMYHDVDTNEIYMASNGNMPFWGATDDAFMVKWNSAGTQVWEAGDRSIINAFRSIVGTTHGCIAALDFNGGWNNSQPPWTYVWDADGLYVGGLFRTVNLTTGSMTNYWLQGDNLSGNIHTNPTTGEVLFFGTGENQGYIYRITGWDNWERLNGSITVSTASQSNTGQGLRGDYYDNADFTSQKSTRVDSTVNFNWGTNIPSGSGLTAATSYSARWTGTVNAKYGPWGSLMTRCEGVANTYKSGYTESTLAGAAMYFNFKGTSVKWIAYKDSSRGKADVYIDGVFQQTVNTYSATPQYQVIVYQATGLTNADHTLKIVVLNQLGDPNATGRMVTVDGFELDGGVRVDDAGEEYTFYTNAADGARLWIDGKLLINDWTDKSTAAEKSGMVIISPGHHSICLDYNNLTGSSTIGLSWSSANQAKQIIPSTQLYPTRSDAMSGGRVVNIIVPGIIECENYDGGGEGVAYHDDTTVNRPVHGYPTHYRGNTEGVDIEGIGFTYMSGLYLTQAGSYQVEARASEWMKYTIDVAQTANYTIGVNLTTGDTDYGVKGVISGGTFHLEVDGVNVTGPMTVPACTYTTPYPLVTQSATLTAGQHAVKLVFDTNGPNYQPGGAYGYTGKFNYIQFTAAKAATPIFTPAPGTYYAAQSVTITSTPGATIRYTTNGTTPSRTNGTVYSGAVAISAASTTLKAFAYDAAGLADSDVASGVYTIQCYAPTFTPEPGAYATLPSVTINCATSGATIRYTTNGTTPSSTNGTVYSTPVALSTTTTLKAIAYKTGMTDSTVTTGLYSTGDIIADDFTGTNGTTLIGRAPALANLPGGTYAQTGGWGYPQISGNTASISTDQGVSVSIASAGGYTKPTSFSISGKINPQAIYGAEGFRGIGLGFFAYAGGGHGESGFYGLALNPNGNLTLVVNGSAGASVAYQGTWTANQMHTLSYTVDTSTGAISDVLLDGQSKSYTTTAFTNAATARAGAYVSASAGGYTGLLDDLAVRYVFAGAPTFNPPAGTYTSAQAVTISSTTSGATIRYTTDGSTPTTTNGTIYSSPVNINGSCTLKAIAYKSGLANSAVTSGAYVINTPYIISDAFTGTNGTSLIGTAPALINMPGGTYAQTGGWGYSQIQGNAAQLYADQGMSVSIASNGGYTKPTNLTISAKLNPLAVNGTEGFRGVGLGYFSYAGGGHGYDGFTGLALNPNGNLVLMVNGTPGTSIAYQGTWTANQLHTLSYTVNTSTGAISNVVLDGQSKSYTTTAFTNAATARAGVYVSDADGGNAAGLVDDLLVQ